MKRIFGYFLQGVLLVAPVFIVIYILYSLFITIDGWLITKIETLTGISMPGTGIIFLFISLTLLGFIGETALLQPIKTLAGKLIHKIPVLNLLFSALNDLFSAFVGKDRKFNIPVKVLFNRENNLWKLGFVTKETLEELDLPEQAAVYFPHSYNFSGELYLVPTERIEKVDLSPAEAMKFIVSGGVTRFEQIEK